MIHAAQRDDLAHDLHVIAGALGLSIDFLDVVRDGALFFFEALDALKAG